LFQLKDKNLTDNTVVSIYFDRDGLSLIKFGSYDKAALKDPNDFTVIRTVND